MEYDNLFMNRGDTFDFKFDVEGANADLSAAYFSCKTDPNNENYVNKAPQNIVDLDTVSARDLAKLKRSVYDELTDKIYKNAANDLLS